MKDKYPSSRQHTGKFWKYVGKQVQSLTWQPLMSSSISKTLTEKWQKGASQALRFIHKGRTTGAFSKLHQRRRMRWLNSMVML